MFYSLIAANVLMILTFILKFNNLPPQIPLFYSKPLGEDQLTDTWMIIILPLLLNILFFINNFISRKFFSEHELAKKILYYLNLFLIISFTFIFVKIITQVT